MDIWPKTIFFCESFGTDDIFGSRELTYVDLVHALYT